MTGLRERYGKWVLIAGAAFGLGKSYSIELAKQGFNLFMVDNRNEELVELAKKLSKDFKIETITLCIDLNEENAAWQIMGKFGGNDIRFMVYNAAYSRIKKFENYTEKDIDDYLNINIGTPLKLVQAFSKRLIEKKQPGGILMMASLAGLMGMQYITPYAATKAFTWNLAESLYHELKPFKIDVMACIAGATATEAYLTTNPKYGFIKPQVQSPSNVVKLALKNMGKKALYIPGFSNRLNYFILTRILPRKMASYFANRTIQKMYSENLND
jgi:short-subunit dehydrogenase